MRDFSKSRSDSRPKQFPKNEQGNSNQTRHYQRKRDEGSRRINENYNLNIRMMTTRQGVSERVMHEQPCRILEKCGSCPTLDQSYKTQLLQKTSDLKQRVQKAGEVFSNTIVKDCVESEERLGYRHTVKLVVSEHSGLREEHFGSHSNSKRWIDLGHYRQSKNEVVDIGRCPVQSNTLNDISAWLRTGIRIHNVSVYTPQNKFGLLHSVVLKSSHYTRQALVIFVVTKADMTTLRPLARDISEKFMNIQGVFMQVNTPTKGMRSEGDLQSDELILLSGQDLIDEKYGDFILKVSAASYMPVNSLLATRIYNRIEELSELTGKETVLDLYAGAGNIALTLARASREVIAIESSAQCIKDANRNAKNNDINNIGFYEGKVEDLIPKLIEDKRISSADVVVLNPSRQGCGSVAVENINKLLPRAIIYLSSFPEIMFRDIKHFTNYGYAPIFLEPFDTLPGTQNYEVLCYLVKK